MKCDICGSLFGDYLGLAQHLSDMAAQSDAGHVMWLNRNISKQKMSPEGLAELLKLRSDQVEDDVR